MYEDVPDVAQIIDEMISAYIEHRERCKIPVSGKIYRLPGALSDPEGVWYQLWTMDVWDDEFSTTIVALEENPPAETVADIFLHLKGARRGRDHGSTHTG